MNVLKDNWEAFEKQSVKPLWSLFRRQYKNIGLEYNDFVSISFLILSKELEKYNPDKSSIYTYSIQVLKRRMSDFIRNNYNTDKTRANFCTQSLNVPTADDSDTELVDMIVDASSLYKAENNILKIKRFFKTLSNRQKEILFLITIGLNADEILSVLDITHEEYSNNMKKIRSPRRTSKLKNEVVNDGKKAGYMQI